jgi:DNA-binding IclR family transcriptional regulator
VVLTTKIPDLLTEHHNGLSLDELARQTYLDKDKLGRVLRYLAAKHIFREGKIALVFRVRQPSSAYTFQSQRTRLPITV